MLVYLKCQKSTVFLLGMMLELKGAMKEILPSEVLNRDKKGFSAPLKGVFEKMDLDEQFMQENFLKKY